MTMTIRSPAFSHNEMMPALYTCEGENISPPLEWTAPPAGTKSLVMISDDPDAPDPAAPKMTWVHWVLYSGPCPPIGTHRYFFKLYALDTVLPDLGNTTKAEIVKRMEGHILAQSELIGLYIRSENR